MPARRAAPRVMLVGRDLHLAREREHVGEEAEVEEDFLGQLVRGGVVGALLEDAAERAERLGAGVLDQCGNRYSHGLIPSWNGRSS